MASVNSESGDSRVLRITRERFGAFVESLEELSGGLVVTQHDIVTVVLSPHVLLLPVPEALGTYAVSVFDNGLTALAWDDGTMVQCMSGDSLRTMGGITNGRDSVFKLRGLDMVMLCTLGQNRAADRWVAHVDGFLSEAHTFIVHVSSLHVEQRDLFLGCLRSLAVSPNQAV